MSYTISGDMIFNLCVCFNNYYSPDEKIYKYRGEKTKTIRIYTYCRDVPSPKQVFRLFDHNIITIPKKPKTRIDPSLQLDCCVSL